MILSSARIKDPNCVLCRANDAEVEELNLELGTALEKLFHHKLHIQQTLEQVQRHVEEVHQVLEAATA